ncbi:serine/threonine-protein phosphatase 6 regulatory ankyrin repeat subunit B-like isoform X15 [Octopus vulgaris]|uniref:Serine/threonine-protein phosphatase 6 regulatory ankyrin repeat subunit B-like isoform X15 n=1 Tax=Octopus vulgaris TaxID=6645 RepID=A0AA36C1M6_OCTVU|nr:serine/threonine-protein phosphatase 6 regulatory ankyrin repeat subunit B-like isoform X15 [Octopus vulgaris]
MFVFLPFSHETDVVAFLVSSGANVNKQNSFGNTPLHRAVVNKYEDVVKVLLNSKENNNLQVNQGNNRGQTALYYACRYGQINIVELLLQQNGIDVNAVENKGFTALHLACQYGSKDVVELLLQQNGSDICAVTKQGHTPLHIASAHGRTEVVELLLQQNGIDANKVNEEGNTPLHLAVRKQQHDVVASMLAQDSVKLDIENNDKRTPLLEAVYAAHIGIVHKLTTCGANINAVDKDGNNCLHIAAEKQEFHSEKEHIPILDECCEELQLEGDRRLSGIVVGGYLASHGASLYHRNDEKVTPLDCIENQHLKEKLKTFLQSLCWWCQEKKATVTLHPCRHTICCQNCCSQMTFKQCPICRQHIRSKSGFVCPKPEEKAVQTVAESVECSKCKEKVESVGEYKITVIDFYKFYLHLKYIICVND